MDLTTLRAESKGNRSKPSPGRWLEFLVIVAIIVSSAGIVFPRLSGEVDRNARAQMAANAKELGGALDAWSRDLRTAISSPRLYGLGRYCFGIGPGEVPDSPKLSQRRIPLARLLEVDDFGAQRWRGPYIETLPRDPWGKGYMVSLVGLWSGSLRPGGERWILVISAGSNGRLETEDLDSFYLEPGGDDWIVPITLH